MEKISTAEDVVVQMRDYCSGQNSDASALITVLTQYMNNTGEYRKQWADYLGLEGLNILSTGGGEQIFYYLMTFLLHATGKQEIYKALLKYCAADNTITKENKYFLYYQFIGYNFLNPNIVDDEIGDLIDDLYTDIYCEYKKELENSLHFVNEEQRNEDIVIVFISQVLNTGHGPTKTLLDRCYILEKYLNKRVYIINTAEFMTRYGRIPCFNIKTSNYIKDYNKIEFMTWKDKSFAFMQCPRNMPDMSVIKEILNVVQSEKPYFILNIGGSSIVSDLCSNIVPTLTIGTVPSGRTMTRGQFQTIGRTVMDCDRKWLEKHNMPESAIIESVFTSAFKEQTYHYTRAELGLPENRFIAVLIGGRLDAEIDEACMGLLERLFKKDIFVVFVGHFDKYTEYAEKSDTFKENTRYLGFQDDVLAVDEICDVYINPKRVGGGTSAAEALYKGLPVVTFDFGDVGVGAGADFHVKDYDDMYKHILRYASDRDYYEKMSEKATERAQHLMDSKTEFMRIINVMVHSEQFEKGENLLTNR